MTHTASSTTTQISIRRYTAGKVFAFADGPVGAEAAVRTALSASVTLEPVLAASRFIAVLRDHGMSQDEIDRCVESISVVNEAWLQDEWPR